MTRSMTASIPPPRDAPREPCRAFPCDAEGPVFREPWEAQAFAMTLSLYDRGAVHLAGMGRDPRRRDQEGAGRRRSRHRRDLLPALARGAGAHRRREGRHRRGYAAQVLRRLGPRRRPHAARQADRAAAGGFPLDPLRRLGCARGGRRGRRAAPECGAGTATTGSAASTNGGFGRSLLDSAGDSSLFCTITCMRWITRIGNSRRCCTAARCSFVTASARAAARPDIGGGHRVLHREIDADAADRRHGVRGVADAEQARPMPLPQPVDRHRQQLDVVEAFELADAVAQQRRQLDHALAERRQALALAPPRCRPSG